MRKYELTVVLAGLRAHPMNATHKHYHELADKLEKDDEPLPRIAVSYTGGVRPNIVIAGRPVALMVLDLDAIAATPANKVTMEELTATLAWKVATADNKAMGALQDGVVKTYKGLGLDI